MSKFGLALATLAGLLGHGAAWAQYLPSDLGALRTPDPNPIQPYKPPMPLIPGPIGPDLAGPGPATNGEYALPNNHNSAFQAEPGRGPRHAEFPPLTYLSVDLLSLKPTFDRNPAYFINGNATDFDYDSELSPRVNLNVQISDCWSIRGSWLEIEQEAASINLTNTSPNILVASVQPLPGFQVVSPETYRFLDRAPRFSLSDVPPRPEPPFPFTNGLIPGFPDDLAFLSRFKMKTYDLEAARTIELGDAHGRLGMGVQYTTYSQFYAAGRRNRAGSGIQIPGYDPFVNIDDDASINVNSDFRFIQYGHSYRGVGPKLSMDLELPFGDRFSLYSNIRGTVLMGTRREAAYSTAFSFVRLSDIDRNTPILDLDFVDPENRQQLRGKFTVVPMGELEAGAKIQFGHAKIFPYLKAGVFAQQWINAGNATNPNANLLLFGVNVNLGVGFYGEGPYKGGEEAPAGAAGPDATPPLLQRPRMALRFAMLASGSAGNAALVQSADAGLLLDFGLGPRTLARRLADAGASWDAVHAALLTHLHGDHWNEATLAHLARRRIPLWCADSHAVFLEAHLPAFARLREAGLVRAYCSGREERLVPGLRGWPLPLRHDGGETFGFRIAGDPDLFGDAPTLAYAADLGRWDDALAESLADVDLLALEFDHDVALECASRRSPALIARVLGDEGHLSNEQAAGLLRRVLELSPAGRPAHLVPLHLSRECNRPALAEVAAREVMRQLGRAVVIRCASQERVGATIRVDEAPARRPRLSRVR